MTTLVKTLGLINNIFWSLFFIFTVDNTDNLVSECERKSIKNIHMYIPSKDVLQMIKNFSTNIIELENCHNHSTLTCVMLTEPTLVGWVLYLNCN